MLPNEKKIFDDLNSRSRHPKYWMPLVWAGSIIARARKEGRIRDDFAVKTLLDELCTFRSKCGALNGYDWVAIPLVYTQVGHFKQSTSALSFWWQKWQKTLVDEFNVCSLSFQVVTLAVYCYVALTLMGRQLILEEQDLYFPAVAFIQVNGKPYLSIRFDAVVLFPSSVMQSIDSADTMTTEMERIQICKSGVSISKKKNTAHKFRLYKCPVLNGN